MPLDATPWTKIGDWSPSANTPTLPVLPTLGDHEYHECTDNGTFLGITFRTGDFIFAELGSYQRLDNNSNEVSYAQGLHEALSAQVDGIGNPPALINAAIASHSGSADPHGDRAFSVQRSNHTGTQATSTIVGLDASLAALSAPTVTTWASKPVASVAGLGAKIIVTDVGFRTEWVSDGSVWRPANGRVVLFSLAAQLTGATGTAETIRQQVTLPAGIIPAGGVLRISCAGLKSSTAETSTLRVRVGPLATVADPIQIAPAFATTVDNFGLMFESKRMTATTMLRTGGGANTVLIPMGTSNASGTTATTVANMDTLANTITLSTQHSASVETTTIHSLTVELIA